MNPLTPEAAQVAGVAARIGALGMAIVLFAAIWESDGRPEPTEHWLARRAAQQTEIAGNQLREKPSRKTAAAKVERVTDSQPLPQNIAPGRYVVADSRGRTRHMHVTQAMTSAPVERDLYTLDRDGVTLYFIRLRGSDALASAESSDQH